MPRSVDGESHMSLELLKVVDRARNDPNARLYALARLLDQDALKRAFRRIRKDAAEGVDGVTKEQYGQQLEQNIAALHQRMKAKRYRHQPILRVHIPKTPGKTRPIGWCCSARPASAKARRPNCCAPTSGPAIFPPATSFAPPKR